jgi:hypothetical protein
VHCRAQMFGSLSTWLISCMSVLLIAELLAPCCTLSCKGCYRLAVMLPSSTAACCYDAAQTPTAHNHQSSGLLQCRGMLRTCHALSHRSRGNQSRFVVHAAQELLPWCCIRCRWKATAVFVGLLLSKQQRLQSGECTMCSGTTATALPGYSISAAVCQHCVMTRSLAAATAVH